MAKDDKLVNLDVRQKETQEKLDRIIHLLEVLTKYIPSKDKLTGTSRPTQYAIDPTITGTRTNTVGL